MKRRQPDIRALLTRSVKESELQANVMTLAGVLCFRRFHARPALSLDGRRMRTHMSGEVGFPDLVLVGRQRLIFAELKTTRGKLSPEQGDWLVALSGIPPVEVYLWTTDDWLSGRIEAILRGRPA